MNIEPADIKAIDIVVTAIKGADFRIVEGETLLAIGQSVGRLLSLKNKMQTQMAIDQGEVKPKPKAPIKNEIPI